MTHPFRQSELLEMIRTTTALGKKVNQYDIQCVVNVFGVRKRPEFYYKGKVKGSPTQYSKRFAEWVTQQWKNDSAFFAKTRVRAKAPT